MVKRQNNKSIKYDRKNFSPDVLDKEHIDRLAVERVPMRARVLDIGCATGFIGEYLIKKKNCEVFGVDISPEEIAIAKKRLSETMVGNIEDAYVINRLVKKEKKRFDVILLMSIIEHLKYPEETLVALRQLLKKDGVIIVSTPNIAHWTMRLSLLRGNFDYTEYGILDRTHLRLFTQKSFYTLFTQNKYVIVDSAIDSVGGGYPRLSRLLSHLFPRVFAYQLLVVAKSQQ